MRWKGEQGTSQGGGFAWANDVEITQETSSKEYRKTER